MRKHNTDTQQKTFEASWNGAGITYMLTGTVCNTHVLHYQYALRDVQLSNEQGAAAAVVGRGRADRQEEERNHH